MPEPQTHLEAVTNLKHDEIRELARPIVFENPTATSMRPRIPQMAPEGFMHRDTRTGSSRTLVRFLCEVVSSFARQCQVQL